MGEPWISGLRMRGSARKTGGGVGPRARALAVAITVVSFRIYAYTIHKSHPGHIRRWMGLMLCREADIFCLLRAGGVLLRS